MAPAAQPSDPTPDAGAVGIGTAMRAATAVMQFRYAATAKAPAPLNGRPLAYPSRRSHRLDAHKAALQHNLVAPMDG